MRGSSKKRLWASDGRARSGDVPSKSGTSKYSFCIVRWRLDGQRHVKRLSGILYCFSLLQPAAIGNLLSSSSSNTSRLGHYVNTRPIRSPNATSQTLLLRRP